MQLYSHLPEVPVRCRATMVNRKSGIPVVHMCTIVPISLTVGANRIVPTIAIPHPLGNPSLSIEEEKEIRKNYDKSIKSFKLSYRANCIRKVNR